MDTNLFCREPAPLANPLVTNIGLLQTAIEPERAVVVSTQLTNTMPIQGSRYAWVGFGPAGTYMFGDMTGVSSEEGD